uniref:E3 ubiquitin-protein ligase RNF170 n=1 Tax=Lygus hesperus TaxID=30085 RepID=A0A0A9Z2E1_LYGHE
MTIIEGLDDSILVLLCVFLANVFCVLYFGTAYFVRAYRPHAGLPPGEQRPQPPMPHNPGMCPICRGEPQIPVETNCAHLFCGECLRTLWMQVDNRGSFSCPMCRSTVSLLFDVSIPDENASDEDARLREEIVAFVRLYNYKQNMSGAYLLWDRIMLLPVLLRHLYAETVSGQLNSYLVLRMVMSLSLSVLYLVLQTDMIPERFFGILGLLDDLLFFIFAIFYIANVYRHFVGRQEVEDS